jgi:putative molybdopterin biosynthesis protein
MHSRKVQLTYTLGNAPGARRDLHHPLFALLAALHETGSITRAAVSLGLSYRHVWGELKRWEGELGQSLVEWSKGHPARLSAFGEKLLWAERRAQARLAPQIEALRSELEQAFAIAFDASAGVISLNASHDDALPLLRALAQAEHRLHLDIQFSSSVDALAALNDGRCQMAGFHALTDAPRGSPTARTYRAMLRPGRHKLVSFAQRRQGLIVAPGNPLALNDVADLQRPGLRFANRVRGAGSRVVLEELLRSRGIEPAQIEGFARDEPSHRAVAEAVASGSADAAFGIEAAARARGLDFVPLADEAYFLVMLRATLEQPHVQSLLALLRSDRWRTLLATVPGYAARGSGEVLSLRSVLPWWSWRKPKR